MRLSNTRFTQSTKDLKIIKQEENDQNQPHPEQMNDATFDKIAGVQDQSRQVTPDVGRIKAKLVGKIINISEYKVEFHFWIFVKIFVYQFTFFCTGIFTALFVTIVEGYNFAENMLFIG